ncbi:MAG: hypothetical protein Q8L81_01890 [Bacteroidota bacterium]|nr:hypothetical protein [Bacteroidota bacterium]
MSIEITKEQRGTYKSHSPDKGCGALFKGKVRFTKSHLYVGKTSFKFIVKPEMINGDSISTARYSGDFYSKHKILATMTLQNSKLHTEEIIKYYKIIEY